MERFVLKNGLILDYLKNASLDLFDFLHEVRRYCGLPSCKIPSLEIIWFWSYGMMKNDEKWWKTDSFRIFSKTAPTNLLILEIKMYQDQEVERDGQDKQDKQELKLRQVR